MIPLIYVDCIKLPVRIPYTGLHQYLQVCEIFFINLPRQATVRIYSLSGDLVWERYFENPTDASGEPPGWNLVSRNNQEIVSGIYIVHTESPLGTEINKFVVVR